MLTLKQYVKNIIQDNTKYTTKCLHIHCKIGQSGRHWRYKNNRVDVICTPRPKSVADGYWMRVRGPSYSQPRLAFLAFLLPVTQAFQEWCFNKSIFFLYFFFLEIITTLVKNNNILFHKLKHRIVHNFSENCQKITYVV